MGKSLNRRDLNDERVQRYFEECIEVFDNLGIMIPVNVSLKQADSLAWFGQATYRDNSVTLSSYILSDPENKIKPVILHELAHLAANLIEPGCGHCGAWKRVAMRVGSYTGYIIKRTDSKSNHREWAQAKKTTIAKMQTYKFVCPSCGVHLTYHKRTEFVRNYDKVSADGIPAWWCGSCNRKLHKKIAFIKED